MTYTPCRLSPGKAINRASSLSIHFSLEGRKTHSGMHLAVRVTLRNAIRAHPPLMFTRRPFPLWVGRLVTRLGKTMFYVVKSHVC